MSRFEDFSIGVLLEDHIEELLGFENEQLRASVDRGEHDSLIDAEVFSWVAPWRKESLEHYLCQGWSFSIRDLKNDQLQGYYLAQPLLFLQGQTQSLWVEHVQALSEKGYRCLFDVAYQQARDKHLQRVYFTKQAKVQESSFEEKFKWQALDDKVFFVKTTKG